MSVEQLAEPGTDEEVFQFYRRAKQSARNYGIRPDGGVADPEDIASSALVIWMRRGRTGGSSYQTAKWRIFEVFELNRRRVEVEEADTYTVECSTSSYEDPELILQAKQSLRREQPEPIDALRELFHTTGQWTAETEAQAREILAQAHADGRAAQRSTSSGSPRDRVMKWIRENDSRPVTQRELAQECGLPRETLNRALRRMGDEGIVERVGKVYRIREH